MYLRELIERWLKSREKLLLLKHNRQKVIQVVFSTHKYSLLANLTKRRGWPINSISVRGVSPNQGTLIFEDSVKTEKDTKRKRQQYS